jgi:hypothetical protein
MTAAINDYGLDIEPGWPTEQLQAFIELANQACNALASREGFTAAEIAAWPPVLDKWGIEIRGEDVVYTAPIVELGRAIIALVQGSLPPPPEGKDWYYGHPGGRVAL